MALIGVAAIAFAVTLFTVRQGRALAGALRGDGQKSILKCPLNFRNAPTQTSIECDGHEDDEQEDENGHQHPLPLAHALAELVYHRARGPQPRLRVIQILLQLVNDVPGERTLLT